MNGKRAEIKGHEKCFSKKPCPIQRSLGMDGHFAKRCFWHRMRRDLSNDLKERVNETNLVVI